VNIPMCEWDLRVARIIGRTARAFTLPLGSVRQSIAPTYFAGGALYSGFRGESTSTNKKVGFVN